MTAAAVAVLGTRKQRVICEDYLREQPTNNHICADLPFYMPSFHNKLNVISRDTHSPHTETRPSHQTTGPVRQDPGSQTLWGLEEYPKRCISAQNQKRQKKRVWLRQGFKQESTIPIWSEKLKNPELKGK